MYEKMIFQNILADAGVELPQEVTAAAQPAVVCGHSWSEQDLTQLEESAKQVIATSDNVLAVERAERLIAAIKDQREYPADA